MLDYNSTCKKYFIWNYRPEDIRSDGAYYISGIYDSKGTETIWHRAEIKDTGQIHPYSVYFYAADSINGGWKELLEDEVSTFEEKKKRLTVYHKKTIHNRTDCLLHEITGRYLWYLVEFKEMPYTEIQYIKIYFPKESFLSYLPEVYGEDKENADFLERFLSVFQAIHEMMDEEIDKLPLELLPKTCKKQQLPYVAKLLAEDLWRIWEEEKLEKLLSEAIRFYGYRGTKRGLLERIGLFTGEEAYLAEYHKFDEERKSPRKELVESLYGDDPFVVTLLVREECLESKDSYIKLAKIAESCIPAHMECRLVVIRSYIFLDTYSYLGINSVLRMYDSFDLGRSSVIPYSVI